MTVAEATLPHWAKKSRRPSLVVEKERLPTKSFCAMWRLRLPPKWTRQRARKRTETRSEMRGLAIEPTIEPDGGEYTHNPPQLSRRRDGQGLQRGLHAAHHQ